MNNGKALKGLAWRGIEVSRTQAGSRGVLVP